MPTLENKWLATSWGLAKYLGEGISNQGEDSHVLSPLSQYQMQS